ncbi:MAG TPA: hypothetical protein VI168_12940 [Croceibacterium sp.]
MPDRLSPPDAARRRYNIVHTLVMFAFAGSIVAVARFGPGAAPALRWALVALPAVLLALAVWEFVRMVRRDDEMMQLLYLRAVSISAGAVLVAGTIWGMIEVLLGTPAFPAFLLLPAFATIYGVVFSVLSSRR